MAARRPRGALYSGRGKRVTRLSLQRARRAGQQIKELRTASGRPLRGRQLSERLAKVVAPLRLAPRRPGEEREIIEAGARFPQLVIPWSSAQTQKIDLWQYAVTQGSASGDFERTLEDVLGIDSGGRYRVFVAGPGGRQPVDLETDPNQLRDLSDASMLADAERRSYPRAQVPAAA